MSILPAPGFLKNSSARKRTGLYYVQLNKFPKSSASPPFWIKVIQSPVSIGDTPRFQKWSIFVTCKLEIMNFNEMLYFFIHSDLHSYFLLDCDSTCKVNAYLSFSPLFFEVFNLRRDTILITENYQPTYKITSLDHSFGHLLLVYFFFVSTIANWTNLHFWSTW